MLVSELDSRKIAPVLRQYAREVPVTRPFFDAGPDGPLEAFAAEATRHPVFRIMLASTASESTRTRSGRLA